MKFTYKVDNIKNGRLLTETAGTVFENNKKDINFIYFMISDLRKKHPDYITGMEQFYGMDIDSILKKFEDSKEDLRKVELGFSEMVDRLNKFNRGGRPLAVSKTSPKILPKFKPEVLKILENGSLDDKIQILLKFIDKGEKDNRNNILDLPKYWGDPSVKNFIDDINNLRNNSVTFIRNGLLKISTKQERLMDC